MDKDAIIELLLEDVKSARSAALTAHLANAAASETFIAAPSRCCRNGAKPIAPARQTNSR